MFLVAAMANATMDSLSFHYAESPFAQASAGWQHWLNPAISWHNKWKNGDPAQRDAFPLSSTGLVWTTDAWHLAKAIMMTALVLAILAPFRQGIGGPWWAWLGVFFAIALLWGVIFETLFRCNI